VLEGAIRPGHFRGVCTVVLKLLNIVEPQLLFMGQKDYQQNAVLTAMISDLNVPTKLMICPTRREPDGLAMSSRNRYLDPAQRAQATALYQAQMWAKSEFEAGQTDAAALATGMRERITAGGLKVQYAAVADARTLEILTGPVKTDAVLLVAAQLGATRLIDNMLLNWKLPGM
jgi:pantoate--beta-alanine ligase